MTNKEIAGAFSLLAKVMELHGENKFKIRSYQTAYNTLRKFGEPLADMNETQLAGIKGVGKAIAGKIKELVDTGKMSTLSRYLDQTPEGIQEMLQIKGFGPKKVKVIWEELGIESIGELLYAVNENRLIELKGFGQKTQEDLKQKLEYYQRSRNRFHFAVLETEYLQILPILQKLLPGAIIEPTGAFRRKVNTPETIELMIIGEGLPVESLADSFQDFMPVGAHQFRMKTDNAIPVLLHCCLPAECTVQQFTTTGGEPFLVAFQKMFPDWQEKQVANESELFEKCGLPYLPPELRETEWGFTLARQNKVPELLEEQDIKGVVHSHSTYSDGIHSLKEMAVYSRSLGFEYLVITDHSQSAFYAGGLSPERVYEQMEEIDRLNTELAPFRIFKGIESDILSDGRLDYEEDVLAAFEVIIASVHSNLRMDEGKATQRLITAIENPHTTLLGHPTGRLLLSREGYPIDHKAVIDACAANGVGIELNANPYRLDLDWSWIPYAMEKEVLIAINPDAHSKEGIHDIKFGVYAARKGGLTASGCWNAKSKTEIERLLKQR